MDRPKIVCISGSMKFEGQMRAAAVDLSLEGAIVTGPFVNMKKPDPRWATDELADLIKVKLDELHFRKIDLADEVLVVAPNGYVGDSTKREMDYASRHGKPICFYFGRDVTGGSTASRYLVEVVLNGACTCVDLCSGEEGGCRLCSVLDEEWPCPNLDDNDYPSTDPVVPAEVMPELDRPTAEVAQMRGLLAGWDRYARRTVQQKREWRRRVSEAEAEVSRLREQLARAVLVWPHDAMVRIRECIADPSRMLPRYRQSAGEPYETVAGWGARAVLKLMETWGVSSSEVEAPQPEDVVTLPANWAQQIGWLFDVDEVERYTKVVHLVQMWQGERDGTGDTEAEEATQHKVSVRPHGDDWWAAKCPECDVIQYSKTREVAEDWRDQHEADTLRPTGVLPGEFFEEDEPVEKVVAAFDNGLKFTTAPSTSAAPIHLEGRPSGSERLAPRPVDTMALVRKFHEAFGLPIHDRTRTLNKLRADLIREEAREAADAIETQSRPAWAKELADLAIVTYGAALTMGIDLDEAVRLVHASNMSKLGDDGKPVMREDGKVLKGPNYVPPDMSSALLQDAAQAARSEATPKPARYLTSTCHRWRCGHTYNWHASTNRCEACPCEGFVDEPAPSPSLRKEGEDRD